ncbi:penicillin-binding protein activator [Rheinheimera riviphila]|uniref:Penicillin-binding protein activator n=1 Tax=Rheinheimera riviphila TaxID=1834037 RepID=A0A437QBF3_9GAMM|nr:penicillin-binding protein activator [Rheinheimera riviphila]RVU31856.1 penicillin-binding protein activator [Rheinheimera riviphila]
MVKPVVAPVADTSLQEEAEAEAFRLKTEMAQSSAAQAAAMPVAQDETEQQQRDLLAEAQQLLASNQNLPRALAITHSLRDSSYGLIRQQNMLPLLQSYLASQQFATLELWLADQQLTDVAPNDRSRFTELAAGFYQSQKQLVPALRWLLAQDELAGNAKADAKMQDLLWSQLVQLNPAELQQLSKNARPRAAAWLNLVQIALSFAGDAASMTAALQDWQQRHPGMPALADLPSSINTLANTPAYQPQRIGVVLPLSGPFKALGEAVQLGLVSANTSANTSASTTASSSTNTEIATTGRSLVFIDSTLPAADIAAALELAQVEFVIGPLLREDVDKVQSLPNWRWPTLFLNSKQNSDVAPVADQFYFSLSAEDEAAQMVDLFRQQHYQHPILISAQNPISQRMAQHFQQMWQQNGGKVVESYTYNNQEELRTLINTFLETAASTERIKELERFTGRSVKAEMHSRLDIDAIYLLADPAQTRLVKPFIDVTVSPTAPALPVYASSRSHSLAIDRTDIRDLAGLTMTEMPWLVPQAQKSALRTEFETLFAEQDETQQRLFAMGHDALTLVGRLKQQQLFPSLVYHGLTGSLRLTPQQAVQRQLTVATYRGGKLVPQNGPLGQGK